MRSRTMERRMWRNMSCKIRHQIRATVQNELGVPSYVCPATWHHIRKYFKDSVARSVAGGV